VRPRLTAFDRVVAAQQPNSPWKLLCLRIKGTPLSSGRGKPRRAWRNAPTQELCARCLKHNQSCARAWEMAGAIAERGASHADAAAKYDAAWRLSGRCGAAAAPRPARLVPDAPRATAPSRRTLALPRLPGVAITRRVSPLTGTIAPLPPTHPPPPAPPGRTPPSATSSRSATCGRAASSTPRPPRRPCWRPTHRTRGYARTCWSARARGCGRETDGAFRATGGLRSGGEAPRREAAAARPGEPDRSQWRGGNWGHVAVRGAARGRRCGCGALAAKHRF
jgi:hypothetical protein